MHIKIAITLACVGWFTCKYIPLHKTITRFDHLSDYKVWRWRKKNRRILLVVILMSIFSFFFWFSWTRFGTRRTYWKLRLISIILCCILIPSRGNESEMKPIWTQSLIYVFVGCEFHNASNNYMYRNGLCSAPSGWSWVAHESAIWLYGLYWNPHRIGKHYFLHHLTRLPVSPNRRLANLFGIEYLYKCMEITMLQCCMLNNWQTHKINQVASIEWHLFSKCKPTPYRHTHTHTSYNIMRRGWDLWFMSAKHDNVILLVVLQLVLLFSKWYFVSWPHYLDVCYKQQATASTRIRATHFNGW